MGGEQESLEGAEIGSRICWNSQAEFPAGRVPSLTSSPAGLMPNSQQPWEAPRQPGDSHLPGGGRLTPEPALDYECQH
jgi:hypothetical protein